MEGKQLTQSSLTTVPVGEFLIPQDFRILCHSYSLSRCQVMVVGLIQTHKKAQASEASKDTVLYLLRPLSVCWWVFFIFRNCLRFRNLCWSLVTTARQLTLTWAPSSIVFSGVSGPSPCHSCWIKMLFPIASQIASPQVFKSAASSMSSQEDFTGELTHLSTLQGKQGVQETNLPSSAGWRSLISE